MQFKSVLESTLTHNRALQQQLKSKHIDRQNMEALQHNAQAQAQHIKHEQDKNATLQNELMAVQKHLKMTLDEKDGVIVELRKEMAEMERTRNSQNVLCRSLSVETTTLRSQLRETMAQMQHVMCKMDDDSDRPKPADGDLLHFSGVSLPRQTQQVEGGDRDKTSDDVSPDNRYVLLSAQLQQMELFKAENAALKRDVAEHENELTKVVAMNNRWSSYNNQREEHVKSLQQTINALKIQLQSSKTRDESTPTATTAPTFGTSQQLESIDQTILQYKKRVQQAEDETMQEADECRKLRQRVAMLQNELQRRGAAAADPGEIAAYKSQIKLITDDFKQERQDRERQHDRADRLQEELVEVKALLSSLQRSNMIGISQRRDEALRKYERQYGQEIDEHRTDPQTNYVARGQPTGYVARDCQPAGYVARDCQPNEYIARGQLGRMHECDVADNDTGDQWGEDVVDYCPPQNAAATALNHDEKSQCPKCRKDFPANDPTQLLEHMDNECE